MGGLPRIGRSVVTVLSNTKRPNRSRRTDRLRAGAAGQVTPPNRDTDWRSGVDRCKFVHILYRNSGIGGGGVRIANRAGYWSANFYRSMLSLRPVYITFDCTIPRRTRVSSGHPRTRHPLPANSHTPPPRFSELFTETLRVPPPGVCSRNGGAWASLANADHDTDGSEAHGMKRRVPVGTA